MALDLFVNENDEIRVDFVVAPDKNNPKTLYCDISKEKLIEIYGDEIDISNIEFHHAIFRRPSFEDISKLQNSTFSIVGSEMKINDIRLYKMINLLKSWSLSRPDNAAEEVKKLNPIIALVIGSELDRLTA